MFWWGAFGSILLFIPYFPRSKHMHIFLAPINLALKKDKPGVLQPMDFEKEEVFGAAKLEEFTWPRLLDSYSCIMCNRCQDVCPATNTGKALSPAAILINERLRAEQDFSQRLPPAKRVLGLCSNLLSAKSRLGRARPAMLASRFVRWATSRCCTLSTSVASACSPRQNFPRACKILSTTWNAPAIPGAWLADERLAWAKGLPFPVPTIADKTRILKCSIGSVAPSLSIPRAQKIARSMAQLFNAAGLDWAVIGKRRKVHRRHGAAHRQRISLRADGGGKYRALWMRSNPKRSSPLVRIVFIPSATNIPSSAATMWSSTTANSSMN